MVGAGRRGSQVFTLEGAEHAYRVLIESMNEGALTLTADKTILYANQCFARMVKCPLEQLMGGSLGLSLRRRTGARLPRPAETRPKIRPPVPGAAQGERRLADAGLEISIPAAGRNGRLQRPGGLVVTDLTEAERNEEHAAGLDAPRGAGAGG